MAEPHPPSLAPARRRGHGRVVGLDVARALALFGMMATHLLPESVDGRHVAWWQQLAGGRSAALFALLAGVSLALVTDRSMARDRDAGDRQVSRRTALRAARTGIVMRAFVVGVLGLLLGGMDTGIAVILTYYAVLFVLALPFLGLGPRALVALAAGWAVVMPVLSHLVRQYLPERLGASPSLDFVALHPLRLVAELLLTGYYPALPWLAYMLVGMAVARLPLHRPATAVRLAVSGAVLAAGAWSASWLLLHRLGGMARLRATVTDIAPFDTLPVDQSLVQGLFGTTPTTSWWWLTVAAPHSSTPFDLYQTIGSALGMIGLCLLAGQFAPRLLGTLFAAGTMTLTLYSLHLVALAAGAGPPRETAALFWWHIAAAVLFGVLWRATVGRGPFEAFTGSCSAAARSSVLAGR